MPRSRATSSAILFSTPSPARWENGRLLGSEQTRKAAACAVTGRNANTAARRLMRMAASIGKREHQQRAAAAGHARKIADRAGEAKRAVAHARIDLGIGDGARPAADAVQDRDILVAVAA